MPIIVFIQPAYFWARAGSNWWLKPWRKDKSLDFFFCTILFFFFYESHLISFNSYFIKNKLYDFHFVLSIHTCFLFLIYRTKETLASGNFLSVINVLMQLRKVCNHPNLFEPRPTVSPFMIDGICYQLPSIIWTVTDYDPFKVCFIFVQKFIFYLYI